MKRLILIRHGETGDNKQNPNRTLTANGIRDVKATANLVVKYIKGNVVIVTSPKIRAKVTAEILSSILYNIHVIVDEVVIRNSSAISKEVEIGRRNGIRAAITYLSTKNDKIEMPKVLSMRIKNLLRRYFIEYETVIIVSHEGFLEAVLMGLNKGKIVAKSFKTYFEYTSFAVIDIDY